MALDPSVSVFDAVGQWYLDLNGDHIFSLPFDVKASYGQPADLPVVGRSVDH